MRGGMGVPPRRGGPVDQVGRSGGGGPGSGQRMPMGPNQGPNPNGGGRIPFDLTYFDDIFPRVFPTPPDDTELTACILKRNTEISATNEEIQAIQSLVTRVQAILENIILAPGAFDACQVEEVRQVGSFKQLTILNGHKTADFVVILKTLPTKEAVEALCNKIADELRQTECVRHTVTPRGFDISNVQATARIMITTIPPNLRKLDPELHLEAKLMNDHLQAIRHSRWFEENAHNSTIKVIIRILRDMRLRFAGLQCLSTWMMDMLAHYATMNNPNRVALPVNQAFRRVISLIGGGFYLPGYAGTAMRNHNLTLEDMDLITTTGQTLLRVLGHGGYKAILGLEGRGDIVKAATVWNGVVVLPSELVYEKRMDIDEGDEEDLVEENGGGGTSVN